MHIFIHFRRMYNIALWILQAENWVKFDNSFITSPPNKHVVPTTMPLHSQITMQIVHTYRHQNRMGFVIVPRTFSTKQKPADMRHINYIVHKVCESAFARTDRSRLGRGVNDRRMIVECKCLNACPVRFNGNMKCFMGHTHERLGQAELTKLTRTRWKTIIS